MALLTILGTSCGNDTEQSPEWKLLETDTLQATVETEPVSAPVDEDAADDPALWINFSSPAASFVIGSNKKAGIHVYDLKGHEKAFAPIGDINNVDVRYRFPMGDRTIDLVGGSNRSHNTLSLLELHPVTGELTQLDHDSLVSGVSEVYGFCFYHSKATGQHYAFINGKDGTIEQWKLEAAGDSAITGSVVRTLTLDSQPEGMVADDINGILFAGEEERGIWKFPAEPGNSSEGAFIPNSGEENPAIRFDIEGITLYSQNDTSGYLIASSQGNNSFAVFDRQEPHAYITSFTIDPGKIDGAEETDGIDITNVGLNDTFPAGVFVVQDGFNYNGTKKVSQNFKLVDVRRMLYLVNPDASLAPDYIPYNLD